MEKNSLDIFTEHLLLSSIEESNDMRVRKLVFLVCLYFYVFSATCTRVSKSLSGHYSNIFFSFFAHIDGTAIWVTSLEPVLCGHVSEVEYRGIISASAPSEKQPVVPVSPGSKRERVKEC